MPVLEIFDEQRQKVRDGKLLRCGIVVLREAVQYLNEMFILLFGFDNRR